MNKLISTIFICLFSASVHAHAVLDKNTAESGSYFKATIRVSHGCNGSDTNKVIIEIPEGLQTAKPQAKPGWQIKTKKRQLEKPVILHGKTFAEGVYKIIWEGGLLSNEHFDEFSFVTKIGLEPQEIYLPVKQECVNGEEIYWSEIPEAGKTPHDYISPAPKLTITEEHQHSSH